MKAQGQHIDMSTPIVGGNWNNSSSAGAFTLNLNNVATNSNNNVGARDCGVMPDTSIGDTGSRGVCCPAISEIISADVLSSNVENQISQKSKRIGFLYDKICTTDALYNAFLDARRHKRGKRSTFNFERNLGANIEKLRVELVNRTYKPRPYKKFYVYEPKKREINAPDFRDLVVQHAIYREIYGIFNATFIDHSYACRKGMGTHSASDYTQQQMQRYESEDYYLKLDIRKYFYTIDRSVLRVLFERKIKDKEFVELMCMFANMDSDRGIPIGNLLSQLYALIYLNPLDHYVKRELKVNSYVRYVDDFVLIGIDFAKARAFLSNIITFIKGRLGLELSKWTISKIRKGINFVGYRTWKTKKFVRRHSIIKFRKACKLVKIDSIISLLGHARNTLTLSYFSKLLNEFCLTNLIPRRSQLCLHISNTCQ